MKWYVEGSHQLARLDKEDSDRSASQLSVARLDHAQASRKPAYDLTYAPVERPLTTASEDHLAERMVSYAAC